MPDETTGALLSEDADPYAQLAQQAADEAAQAAAATDPAAEVRT